MSANAGSGGATLSPPSPPVGQLLRAAAFAPAVRGYPGGIADVAAEQDEFVMGAPGDGSGSVWQQSVAAWREAGIDWLHEARPGPTPEDVAVAEAGDHNTEPIPVVPEPAPEEEAGTGQDVVVAAEPVAGSREPKVATDRARATPKVPARPAGRPGRTLRSRRVMLVAAATGVALVAGTIAGIASTRSGGPAPGLETPYPPATLAGAEFGAQTAGPGGAPTLTGIAADGRTIVAIGSQGGPALPLPLILVSQDGGRTWARAALGRGPAAPGAGAVPVLVARGAGRWLALGQRAAWTSVDGTTWQPAPALPMSAGDRILGLARTRAGFVAVGQNVPGPAGTGVPGPIVWISANGLAWQRRSGAALSLGSGLDAGGASVVSLRWAAYRAGVIIVGGEVSQPMVRYQGKRKTIVSVESPGLWRSTNGGATWRTVTVPVSHGASAGLAGLAATGSVFAAIRPGRTRAGRPDAVAYLSGTGAIWRYGGRLTAGRRASLHVITVSASWDGFAVSGTTGVSRVALFSLGGRGWHRTAGQGRSAHTIVTGVTALAGAVVVAAGAERQPGSGASPFLLKCGTGAGARRTELGQSVLAAAVTREVTVNSLVAAGGAQVAAGSAAGAPAVWREAADGRWAPAVTSLPASWSLGSLTSVAHGGAGWLAIGHAGPLSSPVAPASPVPVIMTSADGRAWRPAAGAQQFAAPGTTLAQAAAGPAGYVVVGSAPGPGGTPAATVWHSAGLAAWTRAAVAAGAGQAGTAGQMLAVTADRSGFVAAGAVGSDPAVWTSSAGFSWRPTPLPLPAGAASAVLTSVAAAGGRMVAAGSFSPGRGAWGREPAPFAAVSRDGGRTWRETVLRGAAGPSAVTALTVAGTGFVAAGVTGAAGNQAVIVWWSPDGRSWRSGALPATGLAGPIVLQINALSARDGVLTGAGYAVTPSGERPVRWLARYR